MINHVILMGNLVADPELRYTPAGVSVATFRLAVNDNYTTQSGERRENAYFFNVVVWKKQAVNVANFLKKGRRALVEGRLTSRTYEKDGQKVYRVEITATSVTFLDRPAATADSGPEPFSPSIEESETFPPDDFSTDRSNDEFVG